MGLSLAGVSGHVSRFMLILVFAVLVGACSVQDTAPEGTDLTGHWKLARDRSESPTALAPGEGGSGSLGGGVSVAGIPVRALWPTSGGGSRSVDDSLRNLIDTISADMLEISQGADATSIRYEQGRLVTYRWGTQPDGDKTVEAGWQQGGFVVAVTEGKSKLYRQRFELASRNSLKVVTRSGGRAVEQIYARTLP